MVEADFSRVYPLETFKKAASRDGSVASGTQPDLVPVIDVDLSGGDVVLEDVYALDAFTADGQPLEDRVKRIIQNGCDDLDDKLDGKPKDDRSRWVFDATCALVRRGVPDNIILSVLLDPDFKISAHVHDQKSGARKYAIRQIKRAKERVALSAAEFHTDDKGKPFIKSQHNIRVALAKLGVTVKLDVFRNRMIAEGLDDQTLDVDDSMVRRLWLESDQRFRFMPTKEFFFEVLANEARTNSFHPVREYLDSLTWDGTPRLNTWLSTYAGAKDSEFIQSISLIILIAAVRRVRQPGCKFDQMLVLEGSQGIGKSSLVRTLAVRDEWFADEAPLGGDGKAAILPRWRPSFGASIGAMPSGHWPPRSSPILSPTNQRSWRNCCWMPTRNNLSISTPFFRSKEMKACLRCSTNWIASFHSLQRKTPKLRWRSDV